MCETIMSSTAATTIETSMATTETSMTVMETTTTTIKMTSTTTVTATIGTTSTVQPKEEEEEAMFNVGRQRRVREETR